jgi:hypothetical protein
MDWALAGSWGWRAGLTALVVFMLLRLFVLHRQALAAVNSCSIKGELAKQRSAGASWASAGRGNGEPAVVYTLNVLTGAGGKGAAATGAIAVRTTQTQAARETRAVPLLMHETPASEALVADLAVRRTRYLLIEGRVWGAREWDWAVPVNSEDRMAVGALSDNQVHRAWLVAAADGEEGEAGGAANSFPLGEPVESADAQKPVKNPKTGREGAAERWTRCYALGL